MFERAAPELTQVLLFLLHISSNQIPIKIHNDLEEQVRRRSEVQEFGVREVRLDVPPER